MSHLARLPMKRWIVFVVFCALVVLFRVSLWEFASSDFPALYKQAHQSSTLPEQAHFWQQFSKDLTDADPQVGKIEHKDYPDLSIGYNASVDRLRPDFMTISINQLTYLQASHKRMVNSIKSREYELPYNVGTRGVVTTAGGPYLPVALVSIRMLRETGSNLPVEVFLHNWKEFDPIICGKILPALNAKCLVLQDIFDQGSTSKKSKSVPIERYQYKILSILFSSFEEVLFLDSDSFPIRNPDPLFESEPFKSTGLILWPDFWFPSESPLFFEIAGIQAPELKVRASTEAGEMLYSKRKHENGLLLAAYYNFYGPKFYYPLQSQGAQGEGDKETFLWSAVVFNETFYHVRSRVYAMGYRNKNDEWRGSAMVQFDPERDYHHGTYEEQSGTSTRPFPFFAHVNYPKLDPGQIFKPESFGAVGPTQDSDGSLRRIWYGDADDAVRFFGFDLERTIWNIVRDVACTYENDFTSWSSEKDICKKAEAYWYAVFGD